jgi:hypothetical protein
MNALKFALEIGLGCAQEVANRTHAEYKGYKPHRHASVDADHRLHVVHRTALQREEENGYAKGLRDAPQAADKAKTYIAVVEPHHDRLVMDNRYYSIERVRSALAAHPKAPQAAPMDSYWLVEMRPAFKNHPPFSATYYAGWMDHPLDAAKTTDPHATPKFTRREDAEKVAGNLGGTLSCVWQAIEHAYVHPIEEAAPQAAVPERCECGAMSVCPTTCFNRKCNSLLGATAPAMPTPCNHVWVNGGGQIVKDGSMCMICGMVRLDRHALPSPISTQPISLPAAKGAVELTDEQILAVFAQRGLPTCDEDVIDFARAILALTTGA